MWAAWLLVGIGTLSATLPALCLGTHPIGPRHIRILGAILLFYSVIGIILGLLWLPSPQAVNDIGKAARGFNGSDLSLNCDDISSAIPMLERISNGLITISNDGELEVASQVWEELPANLRIAITNLIQQSRKCASGEPSHIIVRGVDSGEIISQEEGEVIP